MPHDKNFVIEVYHRGNLAVFYTFLGSKGNNLLKEVLVTLFRRYYEPEIHSYTSPYYVVIQLKNTRLFKEHVLKIINELKYVGSSRGSYNSFINLIAYNSTVFLWRIFHVAQRFGAIDPSVTKITKTLLQGFRDTIIGIEALKEVFRMDFDKETLWIFLNGLSKGKISVTIYENEAPSPLLSEAVSRIPYSQPIFGLIDLSKYRDRIYKKRISMICLICGYNKTLRLRELIESNNIKCPRCGSKYIAIVKGGAKDEKEIVNKVIAKKKLRRDEKLLFKELQHRALLVLKYGVLAAIILSARGVGPVEATRIINKIVEGEEDIYRLIYEAEKKYLKIKKYLK